MADLFINRLTHAEITPSRPSDPPRVRAADGTVRLKAIYTDRQTVAIGSIEFEASEARLCAASRFFQATLLGSYREAQENEVDLSKEDEFAVETLGAWLHGVVPISIPPSHSWYPIHMFTVFLMVRQSLF